MPVDPISFRPLARLAAWLHKQPNRTQIINDAVARYKDGKEITDELLAEMQRMNITLKEIKEALKK